MPHLASVKTPLYIRNRFKTRITLKSEILEILKI